MIVMAKDDSTKLSPVSFARRRRIDFIIHNSASMLDNGIRITMLLTPVILPLVSPRPAEP